MPPEEECRGRPAAEAEFSDDEEIDISTDFSSSATGHYRGRVSQFSGQAEFPTSPLYTVNEVVYLAIPGQQQPAGPYVIVSISVDRMYVIMRRDNRQLHHEAVPEDRLLVPA